jgi:hypothetical protein
MRRIAVPLVLTAMLFAQERTAVPPAADTEKIAEVDFVCPMDKDVRSKGPGKCPRCGMKLVAGIPDLVEYPVDLQLQPVVARAGEPVKMTFRIEDPKTRKTVKDFDLVHEKLFHLFLVSEDLSYFAHEHPELQPATGLFHFNTRLPKSGPYRVLTDFYPSGGTPQMNARTMFVAKGPKGSVMRPAKLIEDLKPQRSENLEVEVVFEPPQPLAGFKTLCFFRLKTLDGARPPLEQYLGAWGHMLAASEDLIDLVHTHPFIADGGPQVQFNIIFPREGMHRLWVQFQSAGKVNTVAFNVPVRQLR